ncbi:MAG: presqualene diphosphate synthase HpnD [Pseudomonadota bacterium]
MTAANLSLEMAPRDYVRAVVARSGTSFFWAMRLLARPRREANFAVYAFCREVDDIADAANLDAQAKRQGLAEWRREIVRLYAGEARHPVTRALAGPVARYGLKCEDFLAIIEGMEMDADGPIRAPSLEALLYYCDRVACAVGRLCVRIYGEPGEAGTKVANHLGLALQLTNILRDIPDDARMGRLYLPREVLVAHGVPTDDANAAACHPQLPAACAALGARAEAEFAAARKALAHADRQPMRPAIVMMEVYHRALRRLAARNWRAETRHGPLTRVSDTLAKLAIAVRHGVF